MMSKSDLISLLSASVLLLAASVASGKNTSLLIPMGDVTVKNAESGTYYVVKFELPSDLNGKRLDSAFIDFVVDVSSADEAARSSAPLVSVFPLVEDFDGVAPAFTSDTPTSQKLRAGDDRRITIDLAQIVRGWLANPSTNHGLVIGCLDGRSTGDLSLRSSALAPGAAIRITFFYQGRSGERISTK